MLAALIRWQTWSKYSHVALVTHAGVYEATPFKGVRARHFWSDISGIDFFAVRETSAVRIFDFINSQLGQKYDYAGVLRFLPRWRKRGDSRRWFCSEFVFEAIRRGGIYLLRETCAEKVSPGMLSMSPHLEKLQPDQVERLKNSLV